MKTNWTFIETVKGYSFWKYEDTDGRTVYNCTTDGNPPDTDGGYYSLVYLAKVKKLNQDDFTPVTIFDLLP